MFAITEATFAAHAAASGSMFTVFPLPLMAFLVRQIYLTTVTIPHR